VALAWEAAQRDALIDEFAELAVAQYRSPG
ncbi:MAG: hypothetical protein QOI50_5333, partial [Pseudonocardiales bacterium]|nr:hypothetical protein [Pseudonocardiales bacterium]